VTDGGGPRRRGRQGPRSLYWFRTPPGVRVGRAPIDEQAMRLLEEHNPDVEFDWSRLLKEGSQDQGGRRDRDQRDRDPRDRDRRDRREGREPQQPSRSRPADTSAAAVPPLRPPDANDVSAVIADERADAHADSMLEDVSPAFARLGSDGLARLRARYTQLMARLGDKPIEDEARAELKGRIERLNPDAWLTADEVAAALEQYESVYESLRADVGHHPARRR
jgi:hypothetical protein